MRTETTAARFRRNYRWLLWLIAALVFTADQLTKAIVSRELALWERWRPFDEFPLSLFAITHTSNTGAAFGILPDFGLFFVIVAIVVAGAIAIYYRRLPGHQWWLFISLGLQLGGALGNLVDRLRLGYVVDFVEVGIWPVFNVADSAIVGGVFLLAWHLWREEQRETVPVAPVRTLAGEGEHSWPPTRVMPVSTNGYRHLEPEEAEQLLHGDGNPEPGGEHAEPPAP